VALLLDLMIFDHKSERYVMRSYTKFLFIKVSLTTFLLSLLLLSCKSTVDIQGHFPSPVIDQLPYSVGVIFNKEFSGYRYIEKSEKRKEWEISVGDAQVQMLNVVFKAMFSNMEVTSGFQSKSGKPLDLFFQPNLENFQYNVPYETKGNMFEVWLKYNMKVYDSQGQIIADWVLTAYGKTPSEFFQTQESALNDAMVVALRDLGAGLSLKFNQIPEINKWLKTQERSNKESTIIVKNNFVNQIVLGI